MTKKILSLLLAVAMLASVVSVGMFTAAAEETSGTAFADDWSKWEIEGSHSTKKSAYGITDEAEGYGFLYNSTWSGKVFTYNGTVDLGDCFDYSFKMLARGAWGSSDADNAIAYAAQLGGLKIRIAQKNDLNQNLGIEVSYDGEDLFSTGALTASTDDAILATATAALEAAGAQNSSWYGNRVINVKVTFDNGIIKVLDMNNGAAVVGQGFVKNYDFAGSTVLVKGDNGMNYWSMAAFCDISGNVYPSKSFNLPYTVSDKAYSFDFSKFTTDNGTVTTAAAKGYDTLYTIGNKVTTFTYGERFDLGSDFEVKYTQTMNTWGNPPAGQCYYAQIGKLRIDLTNGTVAGRGSMKYIVSYDGATLGESSWVGQLPYKDYPDDVIAAMPGDMKNANRYANIVVRFVDGKLTVSNGDTLLVSATIDSYDFSNTEFVFGTDRDTSATSDYDRAGFYDISATAKNIVTYNYVDQSFGSFAADKITVEGKGKNAGSVHGDKIGDALYLGCNTDASEVIGTLKRNDTDAKVDRITLGDATDLGNKFNVKFTFGYRNAMYTDNALTFVLGDLRIDITPNASHQWTRDVSVYKGDTLIKTTEAAMGTDMDKNDSDGNPYDSEGKYAELKSLVSTANQNSANGWQGYNMQNASVWDILDISYDNGVLVVKQLNNLDESETLATIYSGAFDGADFSKAVPMFEFWNASSTALVYHVNGWEASYSKLPTVEELNPDVTESELYTEWVDGLTGDSNYAGRVNKATKDVETKAIAKVAAASATLTDSIAMNFKLVGDFDTYYSDIAATSGSDAVDVNKVGNNWVASVTGLGAKDMAKDVEINFTATDKSTGEAVSFSKAISVADYAKAAYNYADDANKTVIAYMLQYGAAAQKFFGVSDASVEPDETISASLTLGDDAVTVDNYAEKLTKVQNVVNSDTLTWSGASLVLVDKITVKVYFTGDPNGIDVTVGGAAASDVFVCDEYCEIQLTPDQIESTIELTVGDAKLTYSAATYAYNKLAGSDENLKALVVAAVNYGRACAKA